MKSIKNWMLFFTISTCILSAFAQDKEFTLHPKSGTELTVDLDGTSLTLPFVGGIDSFDN